MKTNRKLLSLLLALAMVFSLAVPVLAGETNTTTDEIVVLYTNDVHTYIAEDITYSEVAALKDSYSNVLLVDAGDHIQGTAYGSMDKGKTIIDLMNAAGYDLATLGNHEFDYGMEGRIKVTDEWANFPYVSANFYHEVDGVVGAPVLDAYKVLEVGGKKLAFVGITTPESFTKSTPAYFQDENGNYIYGIAGGTDGKALYEAVQKAIDAASQEADYVIALGHLGDDLSSQPWTSEELIANTTGLDAFIDGHSHSTVESREVTDKSGSTVILTQTGEYLNAVGKMTISAAGVITTELLTADEITVTPDADVKAIEDAWATEIDTKLGEVIGTAQVTLDNYDADGNRLVRTQETNTGDFAADALYYLFDNMDMDVDVAIMNGGGVRNGAITGDITYKTCKEIHTFGNVACLQTVTGQQLLDALEWGSRDAGNAECGGFLHVSGIKYTINTTIASTVQKNDKGVWTGDPTGNYRVTDVQILNRETGAYEPLDLSASYNLAGYNYTLRDLGDGFAMFDGAVNVLDYVSEDYMVLANYVKAFPETTVGATNSPLNTKYANFGSDYSTVNGSGRITVSAAREEMTDEEYAQLAADTYIDVPASKWYAPYVGEVTEAGLMNGTSVNTFSPYGLTTRGMLVTVLHRMAGTPAAAAEAPFTDVADGSYCDAAVDWAVEVGVTKGTSATATTFEPETALTREQAVTMIYRYFIAIGEDVSVGEDTNILSYEDALEISEWATAAIQWACGSGLIEGDGINLMPGNTATRAELATLMLRTADLLAK